MKNIDITKSDYIRPETRIFVVNDNTKLTALGIEDDPTYVYSQGNSAEIVCFEYKAEIYGDSSETVYVNPAEFNPCTGNKFVTFGEVATICPGNKSVNCALGDDATFYTGYELLEPQELDNEQISYEGYKFLEDTVCFASGQTSTIETLPNNYCVINAKLISTGNNSAINDYALGSNNIVISTGSNARTRSMGCRALFSTGDKSYTDISNEALNDEIFHLVEHQTAVCLGKEARVSTEHKSTVIVQEDIEWVKVGENSVLAIMTMVDNRPDFLLFYTENEEHEYPANIAERQKISSRQYYRLNEHKELVVVDNPNRRP